MKISAWNFRFTYNFSLKHSHFFQHNFTMILIQMNAKIYRVGNEFKWKWSPIFACAKDDNMRKTRGLVNEPTARTFVFIRRSRRSNTHISNTLAFIYHFLQLTRLNFNCLTQSHTFAFLAINRHSIQLVWRSVEFVHYFIKIFLKWYFTDFLWPGREIRLVQAYRWL